MEEREGIVKSMETGGQKGRFIDVINGNEYDFVNPASVQLKIDDNVIFISIITGNGKVINVVKETIKL